MNLDEFIKTVIVDISKGVESAKNTLAASKNKICPSMGSAFAEKFGAKLNNFDGMYYQEIQFDVAVTVESKGDAGAKAGIKVCGIEANVGGTVSSNSSTVSRVKFHVPLGLSSKE
jgi:hypothetical protein